jgi:predicted nuclease of predicted toxin-antitoxin system
LLDANLSPRSARFLIEQFHLDVTSLQGDRLGELPDHEVIKLAREQGRAIVTLDRDYSGWFLSSPRQPIGIIHLDLSNRLRNIPDINRLLAAFFTHHTATIDLDRSLVIIRDDGIVIHRGD